MFIPLKITTEYSLLKSTIKINALIDFLKKHNITSCAICDENLFGVMEFFNSMLKANLKPIIGLKIHIEHYEIDLYPTNNHGYKNLLKIHSLKEETKLNFDNITPYLQDIKIILPYNSYSLQTRFPQSYLGYENDTEKIEALLKSPRTVYVKEARCLEKEEVKYLEYLEAIDKGYTINDIIPFNNSPYLNLHIKEEDLKSTYLFADDIKIDLNISGNYIPKYQTDIDSYKYLVSLAHKGLSKRLKGQIPNNYEQRLNYELETINKMGFIDYFLIVYDYVLYAKKHHILVGPGRGSAAGSLVSYSIGITDIDPLKYNLLFERFLNPERITMPDIDIDFEYNKRYLVIEYVKKRYGRNCVAPIITFGTMASKQVIRDVARIYKIESSLVDKMANLIDAKTTIKENRLKKEVQDFFNSNPTFQNILNIAEKLEGLKRHISTHAAGIVIASIPLDEIIPIAINDNNIMTGLTMEYLEPLGLLKMDFLALRNLTIIANVLDLIKKNTKQDLDLNHLNLEDPQIYTLFSQADTEGIFQFESSGMKNLMLKLKPSTFSDLVASLALFRPGPMNNIDLFIARKYKKEPIKYLHPDLEPILKETYGIIVYQEQVMQILVKIGGYTYAEADTIRRAMSKKKENIIINDQQHFITNAQDRGYNEEIAKEIYQLILKFANYGFNKAHSVAYALIGYQMAYLKVKYPQFFLTNLLNMSIGSEIKTKEYLNEAKKYDLKFLKPHINYSTNEYEITKKGLLLPFSSIKNLGINTVETIINERQNNGLYQDYLNFIARTYNKNVNKKALIALIEAGALDTFKYNRQTMIENIDIAINYATLYGQIDAEYLMQPTIKEYDEYEEEILRQKEYNSYGFYISNHPTSKYQNQNIVKIKDMPKYFDKRINMVVLVEKIKTIKTKKGDNMAFISASDDTGLTEFVIFPNGYHLLTNLKINDIIYINGLVSKRYENYQINVAVLKKQGGEV